MTAVSNVLRYFSPRISKALVGVCGNISEIRLRSGGPLSITLPDQYVYLTENGAYTSSADKALRVTMEDIRHSFEAVCRYSVHSCQSQINSGFVTVAGGHRAGFGGTAVYSPSGKIENLKYINGINFRIAGEVRGAADEIVLTAMQNGLKSVLIFGAPCSGKTTILRDLCRQVGDRYPVSLVDERYEIASVSGGNANNHVGANTDVFSGFSKTDGILTAIRVMSPRMIVCDEIGSDSDISALRQAWISGVKIAASTHCGSVTELLCGSVYPLIACKAFEYAVLTEDRHIKRIYKSEELIKLKESGDEV
ncbi:MAG: stage III sporulation protein AA [Huintestinicola sp.]|uniref:stage III sporulation protein AA n=1 Tax=Huintestinicola sp. TaxID=2981661 RepID=UPI003EFD2C3F